MLQILVKFKQGYDIIEIQVQKNQNPEPLFPNTIHTYENLDCEPYPATTPNYQPQYNINQFL